MSSALPLPSDRSFGFTFFVVFLLVAGWAGWTDRVQLALTGASLSAITLLVALLRPSLLHPLNRAWMKFGALGISDRSFRHKTY